jgi:hypothetical protein
MRIEVLEGELFGKYDFRRQRSRWKINIKLDLTEIGCEDIWHIAWFRIFFSNALWY